MLYPSLTYLFAGIIEEEDAVIEGFGLALFLDLNLGVLYGIARKEAPFLRQESAVSEAEIEALRRSPELASAEKTAGDGVASRCNDSGRRHFYFLLCGECRMRELCGDCVSTILPQMLTSDWLLTFPAFLYNKFLIINFLFWRIII